jgi:hypothetical protein
MSALFRRALGKAPMVKIFDKRTLEDEVRRAVPGKR